MIEQDAIRMSGCLHLVARDAAGNVIDERHLKNTILTLGLAWMTGALSGDTAAPTTMKYLGIGTGTTAVDPDDTALETPVESRATGTQSRVTTTVTNDTYQVVGTVTMTAPRAVTEAGLFSAAAAGTLGARRVFDVMNIPSAGSLQLTWQWKLAAA